MRRLVWRQHMDLRRRLWLSQPAMLRLLRQPLVQFFLLGGLLFLLYARVQPPPDDPFQIVVGADLVEGLRQDHLRRIGHLPSAEEQAALVQRYVDDEILQREATALGLERGDIIVRRRLIQKMEFVLESSAPPGEPSDDELRAVLARHPERYALPPRTSLQHVFVSRDRHPDDGQERALALRQAIDSGSDPSRLGEPFLHGLDLPMRSNSDLTNLFGAEFVAEVAGLAIAEWSAPIASSFGWHLVRVRERSPAITPPLDAIRTRLVEDWRAEQREQARDRGLATLRQRYKLVQVP